jgi:hypothetical protein
LPLGRVKVWQLRCLGLELRSGLPLGRVKVWQLRGLGLELGCPKRRGSFRQKGNPIKPKFNYLGSRRAALEGPERARRA